MGQFKNTSLRYGYISMAFHWIMALLIIGMLAFGLYMADLEKSLQKLKFYGWHKETGILILGLAGLRVLWWLLNKVPLLPVNLPRWQKLAAHGTHLALYALMFAMPLSGWMMSSAAGIPVSFFGLFVMPDLVAPSDTLRHFFVTVHEWLGYAFIALIVVHILAALQHHFIDKDDILRRMLP